MHIKFINTGKGSASSAKEYLLREHDHKGEIRQKIEVLRGNPDQVTAVAESLDFKHTYRSAVIAWHKDDQPTPEQIQEVLNDFERVAFAGLEPNQYTYYAVWHGESNGAGHIHIITPRVELQTGKSMNIAPPGWQSTYDLIVDKYNTKYEWASPKELHRQHLVINDKLKIHADTPQIEAKKMLDKAVIDRIDAGLIKDHGDIKAYLADFGEITREGKDYISLKPKGFKKAIRLKGVVYGREFNAERFSKEVRAEQRERSQTGAEDRGREVKRIESAITRTIEQRAEYNRGRYDYKALQLQRGIDQSQINDRQAGKRIDAGDQRSADRDHWRDRGSQPQTKQDQVKAVDHSDSDRDLNRGRVGNRIVEPWSIHNAPTPNTSRNKRSTESNKELQTSSESMGQRDRDKKGLSSETGEDKRGNILFKIGGIDHDRIRERVKGNYQDTRRDIQRRITESNDSLREEYRANKHSVQQSDERSVSSDRTAESNVKQVREHINELANQYRRETSSKLRELIRKAEGRVGELAASVRQFGKKAIEKVKGLKHRLEKFHKEQGVKKSTSRSHGRGGMSR